MADNLYGSKKPTKLRGKEISSSNSLAFSSSLASLISKPSSKGPSVQKTKFTEKKPDIFTAHKHSRKRKVVEDDNGQKHRTAEDVGNVSSADLHRSKRRMEEKARLYNAMKRGEYIGRNDGLVDFDRKWAQTEHEDEDSNSNDDSDDTDDDSEMIEYTDEFGRSRKGTKKEVEREERRARIEAVAKADAENLAARPQMPTNVLYGDAIQHQAFNPEKTIAEQMAELARKRDKSATPPPDTHFNASAEVRTKGTAFYTFSHDSKERQREMEELERIRRDTEEARRMKEQKIESTIPVQNGADEATSGQPKSLNSDAERFLNDFELPEG